ncbi:MAG: alginate export family protein [Candidatus Calescibacterium sp.]
MKIKNEITPTKNSKAKIFIIILLLAPGIVITLKNQALSEEKTQFSLFGHFRTRAEYRNNRDFSSKTPDEIMFINSRLRLGTDFKINENLSAEGIIQDARVWGEAGRKVSDTAPLEGIRFSATNSLGLESLDFISANITAKGKLSEDITISSKIGRQRLAYGEHRIIGTFDWSNVSNSFDGIKLNTKIKNYSLDLFGFLLRKNSVQEGPTEIPKGVRQKSFFVGNYNILPVPTGSLDIYLLYLRDDVKSNNRPANIFAVGIRKVGEVKLEAINPFWAFEGVYEFGQAWDKKLRAFAMSARAGTKIIENN